MKFRFLLSLPSRNDGTVLPALLGTILAATLVMQLTWAAREPDLPLPLPATAPVTSNRVPIVSPVVASGEIFRRPLFAPRQSSSIASDIAPAPTLGGAVVAGTVSLRGRTYAVVRRSNGKSFNLPVGGQLNGWSLAALRDEGAVFVKGRARQTIAYGTQPTSEAAEPPAE